MGEQHPPYQPIQPLSPSQLSTFLQFISSKTLTLPLVQAALGKPFGLINVLKTLIPLYTSKVPWGGIAYHYSTTTINSLSPDAVFNKLIHRGLGGHCLEMVPLFASALLGLGYDVYLTGSRVSSALTGGEEKGFHGWSHLVLIITISNKKYVVDPQIMQIVEPIPLNANAPPVIFKGVPTTILRLRYCPLDEVVPNRASKSGLYTYIFEFKYSEEAEWIPSHIFSPDTEWYLEDLPVMNVWLANAADSYLVTKLNIKRLLLEGADDPANGKSMNAVSGVGEGGLLVVPKVSGSAELAEDRLKIWRNGKKVVDQRIESERERVEIMRVWFGIVLTEEEKKAILSRPSALRH